MLLANFFYLDEHREKHISSHFPNKDHRQGIRHHRNWDKCLYQGSKINMDFLKNIELFRSAKIKKSFFEALVYIMFFQGQ